MDLGINGLRVLVTAGANGIGLEIARAFVREGASVHVCDVDEAALAALGDVRPGAHLVGLRRRRPRAGVQAVRRRPGALGGLDCLVNNAGIAGPDRQGRGDQPRRLGPLPRHRLTGQFNCARLAVPHLRQSRERLHHEPVVAGRDGSASHCARPMRRRSGA